MDSAKEGEVMSNKKKILLKYLNEEGHGSPIALRRAIYMLDKNLREQQAENAKLREAAQAVVEVRYRGDGSEFIPAELIDNLAAALREVTQDVL
jgi:hypothetical protein